MIGAWSLSLWATKEVPQAWFQERFGRKVRMRKGVERNKEKKF